MDLMDKLINAKKVMNKVETGSYTKGNVNKELLNMSEGATLQPPVDPNRGAEEYINSAQKSHLPDGIKQLMIENPISTADIQLNNSLDIDSFSAIEEKMKKMNLIEDKTIVKQTKRTTPTPQQVKQVLEQRETPVQMQGNFSLNETILREMKPLIAEIIESTIDRILEQKLKQMDAKSMKINENLQIKVGDTIFTGKITGSKSVKK